MVMTVTWLVNPFMNGYVHIMTTRGRPGPKSPEETRQRIIEAVAALHAEVGPAATTISAIAERAGVQRLTVYRHFPDEAGLFQACSAHWSARHPAPDPGAWAGEADARVRLRRALEAMYAYYRRGAPMLEKVLADEAKVAPLAAVMAPWWGYLREVAAGLAAGWETDAAAQRRVRAIIGHALRFQSWRSLADEGVEDVEAARLMACAVAAVAEGCGEGWPGAAALARGPGDRGKAR
jgi:AcrR family transcriptional regulator